MNPAPAPDGAATNDPPNTNVQLFDANMVYVVARGRHLGGSHYAFSDGHAKFFKAPTPN